MTSARRAGYRLLGPSLDYLLHTRPAQWPIMTAHTLVGYALAVGLPGVARGERLGPTLLGVTLWVVCLNGGTLALNSAYDRDEGDVAYLRRPPPPPAHLAGFGYGLMLVGLAAAFTLPNGYRAAYALCLMLSVLYSVPPFRLKSVPGADWVINMWGFGTLTPYAAWAATGIPLDPARGLVLLGFCPLFAALYPLTQIYQIEEDSRRGDRTLARALGPRRSLLAAGVAALLAFALFLAAGRLAGWGATDWWRWLAVAVGATAWCILLLPWLRRCPVLSAEGHQRGMYRALGAWAVTDLAVVLAWGI
ncbi:MAG TPA: UbiA family prenyltransferase [Gemmatimonadales bacterium]|nr:UbiA family prenyltransferase [Gemmatimonadales bacterium]